MADITFERCHWCGTCMTGVFPDGFDTSSPPGPAEVLGAVCTRCDYVTGIGGPPVHRRNLSLIRNTRWQ